MPYLVIQSYILGSDFLYITYCNLYFRSQLQAHRYALLERLSAVTDDPALALHLASLILFQAVTGNILHASGKFVPSILSHLRPHLTNDINQSLQSYHGKYFFETCQG